MSGYLKPIKFHCHKCGKETEWHVYHEVRPYHGLVHSFRCKDCGTTVPSFSMEEYQRTGRIVIPM